MHLTTPDYTFLRSFSFFTPMGDDVLHRLIKVIRKKKYLCGQYFFSQDEIVEKLYILEMGEVEIYKSDENGKKLTLWHIEEGQAFCLANIFAGRAFANAVATKDCLCYYIEKKHLLSILAEEPALSQQFITCISSKLAAYSMLLEDFTFKNVEERLIKLLVKFSDESSSAPGEHVCNLSQNEIASLLGTCREVVSRTIKKLKDKSLIKTEMKGRKTRIILTNYKALKEICTDF